MPTDLCFAQNWACPPGNPKEGSFVHPGAWQRFAPTLTCRHFRTQLPYNHYASTAGDTMLLVQSGSASMDTGDTPCQQTCALNRTLSCRLGSRRKRSSCTRAPDSAWSEHPPAGISEHGCSVHHLASTAGHTILLVRSKLTSTCTGNTPCQRTCASHRTEPFRLGCRKRVASCTPAPGSALRQHLPAHMLRERCRSAPQVKCTTVDTVRTPRQNRPAGLFPLACNSTWKGALLLNARSANMPCYIVTQSAPLSHTIQPASQRCAVHRLHKRGSPCPPPCAVRRQAGARPQSYTVLVCHSPLSCKDTRCAPPVRVVQSSVDSLQERSYSRSTASGAPAWAPCSQAAVRGAW